MHKGKIQLSHWETGYEILYCSGKCVVCGYKLRLKMEMHLQQSTFSMQALNSFFTGVTMYSREQQRKHKRAPVWFHRAAAAP